MPNQYAAELQRTLHLVVTRRQQLNAAYDWAAPDVVDALRFALTEVAEAREIVSALIVATALESPHLSCRQAFDYAAQAVDAGLRDKTAYRRNHQRQRDALNEAADCGMMLLSALPADYTFDPFTHITPPPDALGVDDRLDVLADIVSQATLICKDGTLDYADLVEEALDIICGLPNMMLEPRVAERLDRIEAKLQQATQRGAP